MTLNSTSPAISDLLLHRGNMLLLDCISTFNNEQTVAEYTPQRQAWYADAQGNMPAWIGLELMAQTIAAHAGLIKKVENITPKQGVLLGTRSYSATIPFFSADVTLHIKAVMMFRDESGLGAYDCTISNRQNDILATATLKAFEPEDFQLFLQGATE